MRREGISGVTVAAGEKGRIPRDNGCAKDARLRAALMFEIFLLLLLRRVSLFRDGHGCACIRIPAARRHSNLRLLSLSLASCGEAARGVRLVPRELAPSRVRKIFSSGLSGVQARARKRGGLRERVKGRNSIFGGGSRATIGAIMRVGRGKEGQRPRCNESRCGFRDRFFCVDSSDWRLDRATRTAFR